jgi:hypothetical protein
MFQEDRGRMLIRLDFGYNQKQPHFPPVPLKPLSLSAFANISTIVSIP